MRNFYDILFHNDGNVVFISKRNLHVLLFSKSKDSKIAKEMIDKSRKEHDDYGYSEFCTTECTAFIETYGRKATKRFIDFLYKEKIADLHYGNYGYDALGNLKIIDYSGFNDLDIFS